MWKGRAIVFVEALMKLLVYMRDQGAILLDVNVVRNYFELTRVESIVLDKIFPRDGQEPLSLNEVPDIVLEPITNYLINLPGYDKIKRKGKTSFTGIRAAWFYYDAVDSSVWIIGRYLWSYFTNEFSGS